MSATAMMQTSAPAALTGGKYLTFVLGKEEYGFEILKVREIIGYMDITPVPRTPPFVKGMINLRGQVIAVLDLRSKFGMESTARTDSTCIIVAELRGAGRRLNVGVIVDQVSEVLEIAAAQIEEPPAFGPEVRIEFILGIAKINNSVKILLDVDEVLNSTDVLTLPEAREEQQA